MEPRSSLHHPVVVVSGRELRSLLVVLLLERRGPMTVPELVAAVERRGFAVARRPSKEISDALRWEVGRGRAVRLRRGTYAAGRVAKSTHHRMRARVAAAQRRGRPTTEAAAV